VLGLVGPPLRVEQARNALARRAAPSSPRDGSSSSERIARTSPSTSPDGYKRPVSRAPRYRARRDVGGDHGRPIAAASASTTARLARDGSTRPTKLAM